MELVSIILLTYNRQDLVKESVLSILRQTYSVFELIIIDDGSVDKTEKIIQEISDHRIRYHQLPHSGHTGQLKNFAIGLAKGEWIAFNDSDDLWKPEKLEKQMTLFSQYPEIGFSITDVVTFRDDTILIPHSYKSPLPFECTNIFERLRDSRLLVYNPTVVLRKTCFEKAGFFDESMVSGDYHFNMRLAYYFTAGIIYEPLVLRRVHDSNMSNSFRVENYREYVATFELLYRNKWIEKRHLRIAKSIASFKMAILASKNGENAVARTHYLNSLRQRWYHVDSYMGLLKSFFAKQEDDKMAK
jgi:glycosyltransferase involved in cell wall biosynthesis